MLRGVFNLRVLVANTPRMYRESLALSILRHRPYLEVLVVDTQSYDEEVEHFGPQVLVRDDDGAQTGVPRGLCVGSGSSSTTISTHGSG